MKRKMFLPKRLAYALLTPWLWSLSSGHFRSSLVGMSLDSKGNCVPWLTYSALRWLQRIDLSNLRVVEFGGGASTEFWSINCRSVTVFESSKYWADYLTKKKYKNVEIIKVPVDQISQIEIIKQFTMSHLNQFDIVLVDGLSRIKLFELALDLLYEDGILICDNTTQYPYDKCWNLCSRDFIKIDFDDWSNLNLKIQCTSILLKKNSRFLALHS